MPSLCTLHIQLVNLYEWLNSPYPAGSKWNMSYCPNCRGPVIIRQSGTKTIQYYPLSLPEKSDKRIPEKIRRDFDEAKQCFSIEAYRASATMTRRALQNTCIDKGATKGAKLLKQINELALKGIITSDIKEWATVTRWIGNDAAHPDSPEVDVEEAESIIALTEQLLSVIFIAPAIAEERKKIRNAKTKTP